MRPIATGVARSVVCAGHITADPCNAACVLLRHCGLVKVMLEAYVLTQL